MRGVWGLVLITIVILLLTLEAYTLLTGKVTLSRFIWEVGEAWPLFIYLIGFVNGGLAVHFFWHWDPKKTTRGA